MIRFFIFAFSVSFILSCKKDEVADNSLPVVLVHGYFGSGDSYEWMAKRFTSNGFSSSKIFTFDWNTVLPDAEKNTVPLKHFIEKVLKQTGATKVRLVGHSMGGGLVYNFCKDPSNAAMVENLVLISAYLSDRSALPDPDLPTLNIWPDTDYVVTDGDSIPGAKNIMLHDIDHNEAAACTETFEEIWKFFYGKSPSTSDASVEAEPVVSGRAVSLIENNISEGARIEVYAVDPSTGYRLTNTPLHVFYADVNGYWGPMPAEPHTYYEFRVSTGKPGDRPIHFYREPFTHSDHLVYLRTYPPKSSILSAVLSVVPKDNTQSAEIFFSLSKALWLGRDELTINTTSLTNSTFMDPQLNVLAFFLYDGNKNGRSDETSIPLFESLQSLKGADLYFTATTPSSITFNFNRRLLHTPNWPSADEGISVAVFE